MVKQMSRWIDGWLDWWGNGSTRLHKLLMNKHPRFSDHTSVFVKVLPFDPNRYKVSQERRGGRGGGGVSGHWISRHK